MSAPRPSIGNGGVRNLRAMFENSDTTSSPEPRGRSPAASVASNSSTGHSTSKVRASFVSVDPSGFPHREHSSARSTSRPTEQSPLAQRRASFSLRESRDTEALNELKQTMSQEIEERKNSVDVEEVVPEQAIDSGSAATPTVEEKEGSELTSRASLEDKPKDIVPVQDTSAPVPEAKGEDATTIAEPLSDKTNAAESKPTEAEAAAITPDKPSALEETPAKAEASDAKNTAAAHEGDPQPKPQIPLVPLSDPEPAPAAPATADVPAVSKPATKLSQKEESKAAVPAAAVPAAAPKPQSEQAKSSGPSTIAQAKSALKSVVSGKPPAISTSKPTSSKPAAKASTTPKSPAFAKSPRTTTAPAPAKPAKPAVSKTSQATPKSTSTRAPRASTSSVASPSSKDKLTASTSSSAFVKPPPKSPTRPVKFPSHLTAPTASSAAKQDGPGAAPTTRKLPVRDRTSSVKPATTVKKQTSRASLPGQTAKRPESRTSAAPPDSSFLARMMRPTASSSSKTHEKTEVKSPPRRTPAPKPKASAAAAPVSKAKAKVSEGLAKAKDAVTSNGTHAEASASNETKTETDQPTTEAVADDNTDLNQGIATPDITSNDLGAETPNFEGATIR